METVTTTIAVRVLHEKPNGITLLLVQSNKEIVVPTSVFRRRVELGVYQVENPGIFSSGIGG